MSSAGFVPPPYPHDRLDAFRRLADVVPGGVVDCSIGNPVDPIPEAVLAALSDGTLAFQMQRLSELPVAAVVVEGRYSALFKLEHVSGAWLADVLARLQVRYPEVQVVFADSRKFAEEWTYRFLATALADAMGATGAE